MIWRITDRRTFDDLRSRGTRASDGPLTVVHIPEPVDGPPRVAYAIGRSVGPAVVRNRVRRRLRAQLYDRSRTAEGLRTGCYLVIVRPPAAGMTSNELRHHLDRALTSIDKKEAAG